MRKMAILFLCGFVFKMNAAAGSGFHQKRNVGQGNSIASLPTPQTYPYQRHISSLLQIIGEKNFMSVEMMQELQVQVDAAIIAAIKEVRYQRQRISDAVKRQDLKDGYRDSLDLLLFSDRK